MHSTLVEIFGIPIRSYGLMLVIGFLLGVWRAARVGRTKGIPTERMWDLGLVVLATGVLGARLVYVALNYESVSIKEFFRLWNGGLSFHGGVAFALLFGWVFLNRVGIPFWTAADVVAPSTAIGYAVTRIGCFLNGCCYGAPTTLPWAVRFNNHGFITPPSHPTQIYAAAANLVIFFVLARLEKVPRAPGFVFASYMAMYSIYRFAIEFPRKGYTAQEWILGLTQAQWVSLVILVVSLPWIAKTRDRRNAQ